ncbi:MAG TPA: MerR family transcriptional regulator [Rectinemataceae bacterium]|nr:MerR family transcriptional regulator [Rectinemataceae bacterium]
MSEEGETGNERILKISEMARLHEISRQTLIFYDKEGLFTPHHVDEKGYRYYSTLQIPKLREICLLRSLGVSLDEIREHIEHRNVETTINLLNRQKTLLDEKIEALALARDSVAQRLSSFEQVPEILSKLNQPFIQDLQPRKAVFFPYGEPLNRNQLHLTLMKTRRFLTDHHILPALGFGTVIMKESIEADTPFRDAGSISFMPEIKLDSWHVLELKSGPHACMYKYGMPYDEAPLRQLLAWIGDKGWQLAGTVVDVCILDTTFYTMEHDVDLGLLQVPVRKAGGDRQA